MPRPATIQTALAGLLLAACAAPLVVAQDSLPAGPAAGPAAGPLPDTVQGTPESFLHQEGYVYLNAPLYPSPRQDIPIQVGGTMITNPALAPHEFLYPHDYNAMYGPYYYRSRGTWVITPWGVKTSERWDLQGTEVKVKYRAHKPFWTGFKGFHGGHLNFDNEWSNGSPFPHTNMH